MSDANPLQEQIAQWIANTLDGIQDNAGSLTLTVVRPEVLDWNTNQGKHGDVFLEFDSEQSIESEDAQTIDAPALRREVATWNLFGIVTQSGIEAIGSGVKADTVLARLAATIRKALLSGNSGSGMRACDNLAIWIDCPATQIFSGQGMAVVLVTCEVMYNTRMTDPYSLH